MIATRMTVYLYIFSESMSSMVQLIGHIMFNSTDSNLKFLDLNQRFKYIFVFNVYIFYEIIIYGVTIFLIYGCIKSFPEAFRNFIMKNMLEQCSEDFDVLINVFLVVLGVLVSCCPLIGVWIETL